jgi:Bacterial Ig-like domain (group 3)
MTKNWASAGFSSTTSSLQLNGGTGALNITHGQSVAVNATVSSTSGSPAGVIALVDNLSPANRPDVEGIADFSLSGGSASGSTSSLPGGTYNVSAHYSASSTFAESDSNAIPVTVAAESSTTTLKVAGYYDPATGKAATTPYYGYIYLIDAQPYGNSASAAKPNGAATGTITFKSGTATIGTAALSSEGLAELQSTTVPGGSNSLTASFSGDASFTASTSAPYSLTVVPAVTTLSAPSPQPFDPTVGSNETVTVALSTDSAGAAPTGTVTFIDGSTTLETVQLTGTAASSTAPASGSASFSSSSLAGGSHNISAVYSGDANYAGSTSPAASIYIEPVQTTLTVAPATATIKDKQPLQFTVTPVPVKGIPVPTGSVSVIVNPYLAPTFNIVDGVASVTIPANSFPIGTYSIGIEYSGDNFYVAAIGYLSLTVTSNGTITPTVAIAPPTGIVNFPFSTTVKVSGPSGDPMPTGSVALSSPVLISPVIQPLTNGTAVLTISCCMMGGQQSLTATYTGDDNYTGGTASATVNIISQTNIVFPNSPPVITPDQSLSVTVNVVSGYTNLTTPATGTITLSRGSYTSSPTQLSAGSTTITIPANSLAVGDDILTANYSGDANYQSSTGFEYLSVAAGTFTITGSAVTVTPGATTGNTSTITVTPSGDFTGNVTLTAYLTSSPAGAQYPPTLSFGSAGPVSITGTSPGTAILTISTTAASSSALVSPRRSGVPWYAEGGAVLACLFLFGMPARRRRWRTMLGMFMLLAALAASVMACGGGGNGGGGGGGGGIAGTTAGTYSISVTGTSGSIATTGFITLTVK